MARIALLANPDAGAGDADAVAALLTSRGAEVVTFALDQLERALATRPDRIAVAGGDGTIGCAAQLAGRARVPLAVIPVGTANDFARTLELPRDPAVAAELAARGTNTRVLDLGDANGRPFVNAASAGLSPAAARSARGLKGALGPLAYGVGALQAGLRAQPIACRVRCDGAEAFSGRAWQVTIGLTGAFGAGAELDSDPADGLLDAAVIEARSRARLVLHAYGMRSGHLESQAGVVGCSGSEVELLVEGDHGFNIDGELVPGAELRLTAVPRAYELVVP